MKRFLIFVSTGFAVSIALLAVAILRDVADRPTGPWDSTDDCPMVTTVDGRVVDGGKDGVVPWHLALSDSYGTAPVIAVDKTSRVRPPERSAPSCELQIRKVTGEPVEGVDWRIGYRVAKFAGLAGKTAHLRMMLKADREITFGHASIYLHDGKTGNGTPVVKLDKNWHVFILSHKLSGEATTLEAWLRLALHSKISSTGTVYLAGAQLDVR